MPPEGAFWLNGEFLTEFGRVFPRSTVFTTPLVGLATFSPAALAPGDDSHRAVGIFRRRLDEAAFLRREVEGVVDDGV